MSSECKRDLPFVFIWQQNEKKAYFEMQILKLLIHI